MSRSEVAARLVIHIFTLKVRLIIVCALEVLCIMSILIVYVQKLLVFEFVKTAFLQVEAWGVFVPSGPQALNCSCDPLES
jgi:hypothetical protein